jgi:hypothetical protein
MCSNNGSFRAFQTVPTTGNIGVVTDAAVVGMDIEERTEAVVAQSDGIKEKQYDNETSSDNVKDSKLPSISRKEMPNSKSDELKEENDSRRESVH